MKNISQLSYLSCQEQGKVSLGKNLELGGGENTGFFHKVVQVKKSYNTLKVLVDEAGNRLRTIESIFNQAIQYYQRLLGSVDANVLENSMETLNKLSLGLFLEIRSHPWSMIYLKMKLETLYSNFIITRLQHKMGTILTFLKQPGTLQVRVLFLLFSIFFNSVYLLHGFNSTVITLVLENQNPSSLLDFRSISCCFILYKCVSKILANRQKRCLCAIISKNQSAFVKGMDFIDIVLMAQELVNGYHRKISLVDVL